jgi:LysM repeat protein
VKTEESPPAASAAEKPASAGAPATTVAPSKPETPAAQPAPSSPSPAVAAPAKPDLPVVVKPTKPEKPAATPSGPRPAKVKVRSGETMADVARQWGCSVEAIMMENNLVSQKVKNGQTLKLPPPGR